MIIATILVICAIYSCCAATTEGLGVSNKTSSDRNWKSGSGGIYHGGGPIAGGDGGGIYHGGPPGGKIKVINDENLEDNSRVVTTENESRNVSPKINITNSKPGAVFFPGATYYVFSNVVKEKVSDTYKYPEAYDLPLESLEEKFERREREQEERRGRWYRDRYRRRRRYNRHYRRRRGCGWRCRERRMPWHRRYMGGDTDSHGCSTDAGETWCESLGKCIQNFKPGDCPVGPGSGGGGIYHGGGTIAGGGGAGIYHGGGTIAGGGGAGIYHGGGTIAGGGGGGIYHGPTLGGGGAGEYQGPPGSGGGGIYHGGGPIAGGGGGGIYQGPTLGGGGDGIYHGGLLGSQGAGIYHGPTRSSASGGIY